MTFPGDALLLVGHGSSRHPDAARPLLGHAAALLADGAVAEAAVGLLRGTPDAASALAGLTAPLIHIVPFFMEDGWFTRTAVPAALGLTGPWTDRGPRRLHYCPPVGPHPGLATLIERRTLQAVADPADCTLVLVGHGSSRRPGRRLALHAHQATLLATRRFAAVLTACLEEPPFLPAVLAGVPAGPVAVIGLFAGEGGHVREDLPGLLSSARVQRGAALIDLGTVGDDPLMRGIILDQMAPGMAAAG
jgi:sirohydrochlorin cobaltochelatase